MAFAATISTETEVVTQIQVFARPGVTKLCLAGADALALIISVGISILTKAILEPGLDVTSYLYLWPFLFAFLVVYKAIGLYSLMAPPAEEIQYSSGASAVLFVLLAIATSSMRSARQQLTWTVFLALGISVGLLPLFRLLLRRQFAGKSWWGYPAIVFGAGPMAEQIVAAICEWPELGLKTVAVIDAGESGGLFHGVPVVSTLDEVLPWVEGRQPYAIFATDGLSGQALCNVVDRYRGHFSHILVVPNLKGMLTRRAVPKNLNGMLGLDMPGS